MKHLSSFERKLMLDEITFYSICSEADKDKILGQQKMSFDDFRRLSLLTDYLDLSFLHKFIWDMHAHKFMDEIEELYQKCENQNQAIPDMLLDTGNWLDDFWKQAPNRTVSDLLYTVFSNGLPKKETNEHGE